MTQADHLRMTRQRWVMLEELRRVTSHPTAEQLHQIVRRRLPRISLATIYRNLEWLAERGLVRRLCVGGGQRHFDGRMDPHYHVRCLRCGAVEDLALSPARSLERQAGEESGWRVVDHEIEFRGLCPDCRKKGSVQSTVQAPDREPTSDREGG